MPSFLPGRIAVIHFITAGLELTRTRKREHCGHLLTFLYWIFDKQDTSPSLSAYFTFSHLYIYVTYYWWSLTCFPLVLLIPDMVHWGLKVERPRGLNEDIWRCTWSNLLFYYQIPSSVERLYANFLISTCNEFKYIADVAVLCIYGVDWTLSRPGRGIPHLWLKFLLFTWVWLQLPVILGMIPHGLHIWIYRNLVLLLCRSSQAISWWMATSVCSYSQDFSWIGFRQGLWLKESSIASQRFLGSVMVLLEGES